MHVSRRLALRHLQAGRLPASHEGPFDCHSRDVKSAMRESHRFAPSPGTDGAVAREMDDMKSDLRQALGFHASDRSQEQIAQPYIEYIKTSWTGRGEQQDFLRFFIEVVRHFRGMCFLWPFSLL